MSKCPLRPEDVPAVIEHEIDPRDIEDMLRGRKRRQPRPPVRVKVHRMTPEQHEAFLRKIGVKTEASDE